MNLALEVSRPLCGKRTVGMMAGERSIRVRSLAVRDCSG
jgi:hypothetical protein